MPSIQRDMKREAMSSLDIIWAQGSVTPKDTSALDLLHFKLIYPFFCSQSRVSVT